MFRWKARELVDACSSNGNQNLWREFVSRFESRLRGGIRRGLARSHVTPHPDLVEDLLQDCYCKLLDRSYRILRRCREEDEQGIGAYLTRVAERVALDHLRARGAAKRGADRLVSLEAVMNRAGEHVLLSGQFTAEESLLLREECQAFLASCRRAASRRFPDRDFRIMQLALLEGLSSREISHRLNGGMTPNGVDSVLHRARKRLAAEGFFVARRRPRVLSPQAT